MKFTPFLFLFFLLITNCNNQSATSMDNDFSSYLRVQQAYTQKGGKVKAMLSKKSIDVDNLNIFIRAFKREKIFEVWGKNTTDEKYQLIKTYNICKSSGDLGPKRKEGDYQVPEGFYHIDTFNVKSDFHLSLGINYPNISDKILSDKDTPGSEIFIHGKCVTAGCLPLTDDKMKEVYLLAELARRAGETKIPVHIFPFRMTEENMNRFLVQIKNYDMRGYSSFWENLKTGYDIFETNYIISDFKVNNQGEYLW